MNLVIISNSILEAIAHFSTLGVDNEDIEILMPVDFSLSFDKSLSLSMPAFTTMSPDCEVKLFGCKRLMSTSENLIEVRHRAGTYNHKPVIIQLT